MIWFLECLLLDDWPDSQALPILVGQDSLRAQLGTYWYGMLLRGSTGCHSPCGDTVLVGSLG